MARSVVLQCDKCGAWDSEKTAVREMPVCGPRFDLCTECRSVILVNLGVDPATAVAYQRMIAERPVGRGSYPALSSVTRASGDSAAESASDDPALFDGPDQPDVSTDASQGDDGGHGDAVTADVDTVADVAGDDGRPPRKARAARTA